MNVEQEATKRPVLLVDFVYEAADGVVSTWKLTNSATDTQTKYGTYLSDPGLKVKLPVNSMAGFGKDIAELDITYGTWLFAETITNGRAFAPTDVLIRERQVGETSDSIRPLFFGRMIEAERFPNNHQATVRVQIEGDKNGLDTALGFSCNATCGNTFGDGKTCLFDLLSKREVGTLTIPNLKIAKVTIAGLAAHPNRYWRRGKITKGKLEIRIREWLSGTEFHLDQLPPADWDSTQVNVFPGCDKRIFTCRFWNREQDFSGIGYSMPAYNPIFENPG